MHLIRFAALAVLASGAGLGLAACSGETEAPGGDLATPAAAATAPAGASTTSAGLTISNARLVLAPVSGNPAAAYFDLSYSGAASIRLDDVEVNGAGMAMIHRMSEKDGVMSMQDAGVITLAEGVPVSFAPGGLHVMVMDPSDALKPGGTARITFTLSNGATAMIDAPVRAAGDER